MKENIVDDQDVPRAQQDFRLLTKTGACQAAPQASPVARFTPSQLNITGKRLDPRKPQSPVRAASKRPPRAMSNSFP